MIVVDCFDYEFVSAVLAWWVLVKLAINEIFERNFEINLRFETFCLGHLLR